jgi:hypothetical protein
VPAATTDNMLFTLRGLRPLAAAAHAEGQPGKSGGHATAWRVVNSRALSEMAAAQQRSPMGCPSTTTQRRHPQCYRR